jgi:hypothetical protein
MASCKLAQALFPWLELLKNQGLQARGSDQGTFAGAGAALISLAGSLFRRSPLNRPRGMHCSCSPWPASRLPLSMLRSSGPPLPSPP